VDASTADEDIAGFHAGLREGRGGKNKNVELPNLLSLGVRSKKRRKRMARRTFVAVELPEDLRHRLSLCAEAMAGEWTDGGLRPAAAETIHLTLRFIGDTEEEVLPALMAGLDKIAAALTPFHLVTDQIGGFPNLRRPRVVWVGLTDAGGQLPKLNRQIEQLVQSLGWEPEQGKGFTPHLTLGRVRQKSRPPSVNWVGGGPAERFGVGAVSLIESLLKPHGAQHSLLHRASFSPQGGRPRAG